MPTTSTTIGAARGLTLALGSATLLLVATACTAGDPAATATDAATLAGAAAGGSGATILQPGRPGEAASTLNPGQIPSAPEWNDSDVAFVQMMVPHHAQALEMSHLAETRAGSAQVRSLARRIAGGQGPEILTMSAWLQQRNIDVPKAGDDAHDHSHHGQEPIMGMLTGAEMKRLAMAEGSTFDRLFLRGMVGHHDGAVEMAGAVSVAGADVQVSEMAADVVASQSAEIGRMRAMLRDL